MSCRCGTPPLPDGGCPNATPETIDDWVDPYPLIEEVFECDDCGLWTVDAIGDYVVDSVLVHRCKDRAACFARVGAQL